MFSFPTTVVVPGYYLVCYNLKNLKKKSECVVVPGYYLVCYNQVTDPTRITAVVVPGYYLVCYNKMGKILTVQDCCSSRLLLGML